MNTFQPGPPVDASDTRRGFLNTLTQLIAGAKTFLGAVVMSAGLTLNSVNRLLQVAPPNTVSGQSYTDPAFEIRTSALDQTHLFQIGSGLTNSTWEFAIGWYGSALTPVIASRSAAILFNMATGTSLSCFTPGNADLGSSSNYWRNLYLTNFNVQTNLSSVQLVTTSKPLFVYAAGTSGITETIRLVGQRADSGLKSVVVGTESTTPNANAVLFQVAHSITGAANDAGNGTPAVQVLGNGAMTFNSALRTINTPTLQLPGGSGGFGYGGGIQIGSQFNAINNEGNGFYFQSYGSSNPATLRSFQTFASIFGRMEGSTAAGDVTVKIGTQRPDANVDAETKIASFRTGITNSEVEKVAVTASGRIDQSGTDSSGTPGAATINRPSGISAIASGTNTVTITNNLVTANSRVMVTWYGDHGAARFWVNRSAGAFTVVLPTNATANTAFGWEVCGLI